MPKSYGQYCSLAGALDVVGDRWAPLVVRELLLGPLRFNQLQRLLPGIATDILTRRLRELEGAGIVSRDEGVYSLTERGERLREPLIALARWRLPDLPPPQPGDLTPDLLASALQVVLHPVPGDRFVIGLVADGREFTVRVAGGEARSARGPAPDPQLTLRGTTDALVASLVAGEPFGIELEGDPAVLARLRSTAQLPAGV